MSNTMRPTKPGTLSLTSRPAKRTTANRSGRPTRSAGSSATSKPFQRDPAGRSPSGSDAGTAKTIGRKTIQRNSTAPKGFERGENVGSKTDRSKTSGRQANERYSREGRATERDAGKPRASAFAGSPRGAADRPARNAAAERPERSAATGRVERSATSGRPERRAIAARPGRPERSGSGGPGRPASGPGADRTHQPAKSGLKVRAARPGSGSARTGDAAGGYAGMRSSGTRSHRPAKDVASPARSNRPEKFSAAPNTDRLAKRLAAELPCSRGDAERYVEGGWVTVDGNVQEEPGFRVAPSQVVSLMPGARLEEGRPVTVLIHKPAGMYADDQPGSARDLILPENLMPGDRSGQRYLKRMFNGLKLVTPLERAASGLVVYSQEYAVARKLVEEGRHVEHEYIAHVEGQLSEADLARMQRGMAFEGRAATPMKVSWQNENHLRFALKSPMPGFIEAVCEAAGLRLLALRRLRIGRLPMAGLAAGQWRYRLEYERF